MGQVKTTGVKFKVENAFFNYSKRNIGVSELVNELNEAEKQISSRNPEVENANLWFKFGVDDTLATTIQDVKNDLSLSHSHPNRMFLDEKINLCMENSLNSDYDIQIFYS